MVKLQNIGMRCKNLVSFGVKSLFTNILIDAATEAAKRTLAGMDEDELPLSKDDYVALVLLMEFEPFELQHEYELIQGHEMGLPISSVLFQRFMETLRLTVTETS